MKDVNAFHKALHPGQDDVNTETLIVSNDGVTEANSNKITLEVWSIKYRGCNQVYPIRIGRPTRKGKEALKKKRNHMARKVLTDFK